MSTQEREAAPPAWRELLGREHLGTAIVLAGGVLAGAINIYLAASLLPSAVADLGGASFYAWNMTVYLVAMVVATMLTGRTLSRFGNVGAYLLGFGLFTAGSLACALSPSMVALLGSRGVQGLGAGLLSGLGFAVVRGALPYRLWTRGTALMSAMYGVGNFAGPALGGLFAQFGSWRLAFCAMAVIGAGCGLLVPRVLPRGERGERGGAREPVPAGSLLLVTGAAGAVSVAGVVAGLPAKAAAIGAALLLMGWFVVHERRGERRVFPRVTFQRGSALKWIYLTLGLLAFGVAVESFLPLFGQRLAGLPPLVAGFFAAAVSLGWSVTQLRSSAVVGARAVRRLLTLGPLLLGGGLLVQGLLQRADTPVWLVAVWVPVLFAAGAGIGLAYPHLSVAAMSDPEEGQRAAAGIATVTSLAIAFGTALAGVLVNLGGASMLDAARYVLFAFAAICALGALPARAAVRDRA